MTDAPRFMTGPSGELYPCWCPEGVDHPTERPVMIEGAVVHVGYRFDTTPGSEDMKAMAAVLAAAASRFEAETKRGEPMTTTSGVSRITLQDGSTVDVPAVLSDGKIEITVPQQFLADKH